VMRKDSTGRKVIRRRRLHCCEPHLIRKFFEALGPFEVVVEATSSYEWFLLLIEDLADRCVLAHPKKLRVIAESKNKSDKIDAQVLAEFLLLDMLPEAWRPTPRVRAHRTLVRHRRWLDGRITAIKCKLRHKLANYNADIEGLFTEKGLDYLDQFTMHDADQFEVDHLLAQLQFHASQFRVTEEQLREFAKEAPQREREARAVLKTAPQIGVVTIDAVLSELGDWRRFRGAKQVVAYAGLDPGQRESDGKVKLLKISKEGSPILRWAMIQAAWRLVNNTARWKHIYQTLWRNTGSKKKAIVGVARRLLCTLYAMLRDGKSYQWASAR